MYCIVSATYYIHMDNVCMCYPLHTVNKRLKGVASWEIKVREQRNRIAPTGARFPYIGLSTDLLLSLSLSLAGGHMEKFTTEIFQLTPAFVTFPTCRGLSYLLRVRAATRERGMLSCPVRNSVWWSGHELEPRKSMVHMYICMYMPS